MRSILGDAFGHHVWATLRLLDACAELSQKELSTPAPGTYGSIIDTFRHLVGADAGYLFSLTEGSVAIVDQSAMDLRALGEVMESHADAWSRLLEDRLDPDRVVVRHRDDGSETHAPVGIRLAQALHHGTDHRSQICTALTALGRQPPAIDAWDFAEHQGRLVEIPPSR